MSKGVKIAIGIVAAIAIPFAAPAVAGALGTAKIFAAVGLGAKAAAIGGTALAGAGLGAGAAALTGQDVLKGAALGGVSAGAGALLGVGAGAKSAAAQGAGTGAAGAAGTAPAAALSPAAGFLGPVDAANALAGTAGAAGTTGAAGLAGAAGAAGTTGAAGLASAAGATGTKAGLLGSVLSKPGLTLAAGGLLGSAVAGSGASAAQRRATADSQAELARLTAQDQQVFDARFRGANELLRMSDYADPEYYGAQAARRAQLAGAAARADALRGKTGYRRDAESRRLDLDTARNVGLAYDSGYTSGVSQRVQAQQAGLGALPGQQQSRVGDQNTIMAWEQQRLRQQDEARRNIGALFANIVNPSRAAG